MGENIPLCGGGLGGCRYRRVTSSSASKAASGTSFVTLFFNLVKAHIFRPGLFLESIGLYFPFEISSKDFGDCSSQLSISVSTRCSRFRGRRLTDPQKMAVNLRRWQPFNPFKSRRGWPYECEINYLSKMQILKVISYNLTNHLL